MNKGRVANSGEWKIPFLASLRKLPNVLEACKTAHIARSVAYWAKEDNPEFAAQWADALAEGVEELERGAMKRSKKSDRLMIVMLQAHMPEKYGRKVEANVRMSGSLAMKHNLSLLSDEELEALDQLVTKATEGATEPLRNSDGEGTTAS